jgi:hypothetical protein
MTGGAGRPYQGSKGGQAGETLVVTSTHIPHHLHMDRPDRLRGGLLSARRQTRHDLLHRSLAEVLHLHLRLSLGLGLGLGLRLSLRLRLGVCLRLLDWHLHLHLPAAVLHLHRDANTEVGVDAGHLRTCRTGASGR